MDFDVTVEIPKGHRNKYEVDHETGRIRLDRTLFTSTQYPADYGFIEGTLGAGRRPAGRAGAGARADLPGLPDPVPRHRHVPDDRREGRRRQGALRARTRTRARSTCATSTTWASSTGWRSSTSSRSTRTWSRASRSRARPGSGRVEAEAEIRASFRRRQETRPGRDHDRADARAAGPPSGPAAASLARAAPAADRVEPRARGPGRRGRAPRRPPGPPTTTSERVEQVGGPAEVRRRRPRRRTSRRRRPPPAPTTSTAGGQQPSRPGLVGRGEQRDAEHGEAGQPGDDQRHPLPQGHEQPGAQQQRGRRDRDQQPGRRCRRAVTSTTRRARRPAPRARSASR